MTGSIEYGKCSVCGKEGPLQRKYWHYPIQCECHSPSHFEFRVHCSECTPEEPRTTMITLKTGQIKIQDADAPANAECGFLFTCNALNTHHCMSCPYNLSPPPCDGELSDFSPGLIIPMEVFWKQRMDLLSKAIQNYSSKGIPVNIKWVLEYNQISMSLINT